MSVPVEDHFIRFLRWMGWTDWNVYMAQPEDYVTIAYADFCVRSQLGMLG